MKKDNIQQAIKSIADQIPDKLLVKVHLEGLEATKLDGLLVVEDYSVRHKYLDSGLRLKGAYAPDRLETINVNVNIDAREKSKSAITQFLHDRNRTNPK